jgi:hypothetical protein
MASKFRPYYPRVYPQRQTAETDDVQRGMQIGSAFGKDIQGLGTALAQGIQEARKNALANQLMDEQSISEQPGAGQTFSLGKLGDDGSGGSSGAGTAQDLGTLPADQTFTNPATGNVEPLTSQGPGDDLSQAIAAARLQGSSSAPTIGSADLNQAIGASRAASSLSGSDFTLNPSDYTGGTAFGDKGGGPGTVGGLIHTGGVQEWDLRKAMLAQQLQQAAAKAKAADAQAEASGTGRYALETAQKRATLEKTQMEIAAGKNKPGKEEKNPSAVNIASEPVIDQNQLSKHFDGIYGNGTFSDVMSSLSNPDTAPQEIKDSNGVTTAVTVGPEKNRITIPIGDAQSYVKQQNALRLKQGLSAFRVPGEDQSVGATAGNPYPAKSNLDVYSRAPADSSGNGGWVRLPNGKITHLVRQPNGQIIGQQN